MIELPLFSLKTVLLPGNTLPLKIFEPRYIDMIASCMREESNFGVILIYKGEETQSNSEIHSVGTIARIYDWQDRNDGLLGITALGMYRFEIETTHTQSDGLTIATVNIRPSLSIGIRLCCSHTARGTKRSTSCPTS